MGKTLACGSGGSGFKYRPLLLQKKSFFLSYNEKYLLVIKQCDVRSYGGAEGWTHAADWLSGKWCWLVHAHAHRPQSSWELETMWCICYNTGIALEKKSETTTFDDFYPKQRTLQIFRTSPSPPPTSRTTELPPPSLPPTNPASTYCTCSII